MKIRIIDELQGQRLDVFLCRYVESIPSRSFAKKIIENAKVTVNNQIKKSSYILCCDDEINLDLGFLEEKPLVPQAEKIPLNIIYEDEHVLVIDKNAGMVVHPGAGVHTGTLVNAVLGHCGNTLPYFGDNQFRAGIVHRLDKDTSGVMVIAKSQLALTELSKQFASHAQKRIYHAITYQCLTEDSFKNKKVQKIEDEWKVMTSHGRDPNHRIKYKVLQEGEGKIAILYIKPLFINFEKNCQLVQCRLETGRTHQIRVQMSYLGFPLMGDILYGIIPQKNKNSTSWMKWSTNNISRQMLHAKILGFSHPETKNYTEFETDYPNDFKIALHQIQN